MFKILLNTVQLAISKDARESASAIINLFNKSPEWEKDICTIDASISKDEKERSLLINDIVQKKLKNLEYGSQSINNFSYAYTELSDNLFEYGCTDKKQARILIDVTKTYVSTLFFNSKNIKFNFEEKIESNNLDLNSSRGRGIIISKSKVDEITNIDKIGIKFIIYNKPVKILVKLIEEKKVAIIVESGHDNPSLAEKIINELESFKNRYNSFLDEDSEYKEIIIFLDASIYDSAYEKRLAAQTGSMGSLLSYIKENELDKIRILHSDHELQKLLPNNIFSTEYIKP